jgi:hypothetical protein
MKTHGGMFHGFELFIFCDVFCVDSKERINGSCRIVVGLTNSVSPFSQPNDAS